MVTQMQETLSSVKLLNKLSKFNGDGPALKPAQAVWHAVSSSSHSPTHLPKSPSSSAADASAASSGSYSGTSTTAPDIGYDDSGEDKEDCLICLDKVSKPKKLPCGHVFCGDCIDKVFMKITPACPICGEAFGVLKGNQPRGTMSPSKDYSLKLPGHPNCGTIVIQYNIPSGYQTVSQFLHLIV